MTTTITNNALANDYDRDYGLAGIIAPMPFMGATTGAAVVANEARFSRFVPSRNMIVASLAFSVSTAAGADDACDVGIYDASGTRIVSKGATTGQLNSTGIKNIAITATPLTAGTVYYAAFSCGTLGGTAAQINQAAMSANVGTIFGTTIGTRIAGLAATSHPLPAGPVTLSGANGMIIAVRES